MCRAQQILLGFGVHILPAKYEYGVVSTKTATLFREDAARSTCAAETILEREKGWDIHKVILGLQGIRKWDNISPDMVWARLI